MTNELYRLLMRANYAYYVLNEPFMADSEYDALVKELEERGDVLPIGSDREDHYPDWAKEAKS